MDLKVVAAAVIMEGVDLEEEEEVWAEEEVLAEEVVVVNVEVDLEEEVVVLVEEVYWVEVARVVWTVVRAGAVDLMVAQEAKEVPEDVLVHPVLSSPTQLTYPPLALHQWSLHRERPQPVVEVTWTQRVEGLEEVVATCF